MRQFIKRILYCFIFFFTFLLLMYVIAFCVGKPELNKDRYIKLYDDQNKIFYQSVNNYSGQYVSIDDISPLFFKMQLLLLKINVFIVIMGLIMSEFPGQ